VAGNVEESGAPGSAAPTAGGRAADLGIGSGGRELAGAAGEGRPGNMDIFVERGEIGELRASISGARGLAGVPQGADRHGHETDRSGGARPAPPVPPRLVRAR